MSITLLSDFSSQAISRVLSDASEDVLFLGDPRVHIEPGDRMFDRMRQVIQDAGAGLVYSDGVGHPRIDYQFGSIRDNFDFGPVIAVSSAVARKAWSDGAYRWGGLYDLRL